MARAIARNKGSQQYDEYTPLNMSLENIYLAASEAVQHKKPPPQDSTKTQKQTGKFCQFHDAYGHTTNECRNLQDAVEELIRQNEL